MGIFSETFQAFLVLQTVLMNDSFRSDLSVFLSLEILWRNYGF